MPWYATYHLAKRESAQPVAFAFGGGSSQQTYARWVWLMPLLLALLGLPGIGAAFTQNNAAQNSVCA